MHEFQRRRKIRRIMYSPVTLVILAVIAIVFLRATWNVHVKAVESQGYLTQAQSQLSNLSNQEANLTQSVAALNTGEGIDAEIRNEYLVVKPGEEVAVIVDSNEASTSDSSATSTETQSFWQKIAGMVQW